MFVLLFYITVKHKFTTKFIVQTNNNDYDTLYMHMYY